MGARESLLIINHRVALPGSRAWSAVPTYRVEYIATRLGAVRSLTSDDEQALLRDCRLGLAGYLDRRPGAVAEGGCALFDQLGPVRLAEARKDLSSAGGAVLCTVISVRREDAESLLLTTKQDWERFVRTNWQGEFAKMTGIPESRVRYVAAMHCNHSENLHVHILSWDSSESDAWSSLLPKRRMEATRNRLLKAAVEPQMQILSKRRALLRDEAVALVLGSDPSTLQNKAAVPEDGSLDWNHLRRYHPAARRDVDAMVRELTSRNEGVGAAVAGYRKTVAEMADIKGLDSRRRATYVANAERDLRARLGNAMLHAMVPDRAARRIPPPHVREEFPAPSVSRRRRRLLVEEMTSCIPSDEAALVISAVASRRAMPARAIERCPTIRQGMSRDAAKAVLGIAITATKAVEAARASMSRHDKGGWHNPAAESSRRTFRELARAIEASVWLAPRVTQATLDAVLCVADIALGK